MARRKRHKASNSWFGHPRQHAKAARLGWRHRRKGGRRRHRNAGAQTLSLSNLKGAATSAFDYGAMKQVGFLIGGNLVTTWTAEKLMNMVSILKTNSITKAGTKLLVAGVAAGAAKRWVSPAHANDVLSGGMLSAVTGLLRETWPSYFGGLSDDGMDGMYDYVDPRQIAYARPGINDYVDPRQIATARPGINDYADLRQVENPVRLDGLQDDMVAAEIQSQMV